ncbi:hypothetical protein KBD34_01970 [Patescibacteria group bacterium]|nr:hypothetical protein [Patescibacteria group bacterium]
MENAIWNLLLGAKEDLTYCHEILALPKASAMNYDPSQSIDQFYMTVCNLSFHNALLIISSLIDTKQAKPVSFRNWSECTDRVWLDGIAQRFEASPLKMIRDRIVAHQDAEVASIGLILGRRRGIFNDAHVTQLQGFLDEMIQFFCGLNPGGNKYSSTASFDASSAQEEVKAALEIAKPKMTRNPVI